MCKKWDMFIFLRQMVNFWPDMERTHGNVLLRKKQYRIADDEEASCFIARNFVVGKILNARSVIERAKRDHPMSLDLKN